MKPSAAWPEQTQSYRFRWKRGEEGGGLRSNQHQNITIHLPLRVTPAALCVQDSEYSARVTQRNVSSHAKPRRETRKPLHAV